MNNNPKEITFYKVYKNGSYYYPACKHYNEEEGPVGCDRCLDENIPACIGWEKYDLCLKCASYVDEMVRCLRDDIVPDLYELNKLFKN